MSHLKPLKIGDLQLQNNLILAPLAGISNLPMRILAREQGASLCFTEMVSVNGLVRDGKKSFSLLDRTSEDSPLGVQLFGDNPDLLAEGARMVDGYGELIDINMGCPVRKVVQSGAGSALLRAPMTVQKIINSVRKSTRLPMTIKIRAGWGADSLNYLEIGKIAQEEGCNAVTFHPRTKGQMFDGKANWVQLAELKAHLSIPVIGSGDLFTSHDVRSMFEQTGCDGVMIARGGLGNPWLFRDAIAMLIGEEVPHLTISERFATASRHLNLFCQYSGETIAVREMRKHLCWYVRGISGAAQFRSEVNRIDGKAELIKAMQRFMGSHMQ